MQGDLTVGGGGKLFAGSAILLESAKNQRNGAPPILPRSGLVQRFFRKLLKGQGSKPWQLVTDKLRSYGAAHRDLMPSVDRNTDRYANNLAEVSHQPTRQRERQMRGFKSAGQAQRFLSVHGVIRNLFNLGRHELRVENYRLLRARSFIEWRAATAT
jgi:putative transposase